MRAYASLAFSSFILCMIYSSSRPRPKRLLYMVAQSCTSLDRPTGRAGSRNLQKWVGRVGSTWL